MYLQHSYSCLYFAVTFIQDVLGELSQVQILLMMSISIFNLQKLKYKNLEDDGDDETTTWHISLLFCVQFLQSLLDYSTDMIRNQFAVTELKCLPAIKLFSDWIVCSGSNILAQEAFQETLRWEVHKVWSKLFCAGGWKQRGNSVSDSF